MTTRRIIVVGAGAAGMLAACEAARHGASVTVLEKNSKAGVKILMSGGTRCNLTQDTDAKGIAKAFGRGGRFLQKSVGAFGPTDVVKLFNDAGVATKVESYREGLPTLGPRTSRPRCSPANVPGSRCEAAPSFTRQVDVASR